MINKLYFIISVICVGTYTHLHSIWYEWYECYKCYPSHWIQCLNHDSIVEHLRDYRGREDWPNYLNAIDFSLTDKDGNTLLHLAIMAQHHILFKQILANPYSKIDHVNTEGQTAFHIACRLDDKYCMNILGKDFRHRPDIKDYEGKTGFDRLKETRFLDNAFLPIPPSPEEEQAKNQHQIKK